MYLVGRAQAIDDSHETQELCQSIFGNAHGTIDDLVVGPEWRWHVFDIIVEVLAAVELVLEGVESLQW